MEFRSLGLSEWLIQSLASLGIKQPSAIQREAIPIILTYENEEPKQNTDNGSEPGSGPPRRIRKRRRDVFACSQTGSGKTLAYVLPILELLLRDPRPYFALILAPTRELAYQISEIIKVLTGAVRCGTYMTVRSLLLIGGSDSATNSDDIGRDLWMGKPNIIIATPGRLLDMLNNRNFLDVCGQRRTLKFDMLIMDEADQLVTGGFVHQMKDILEWVDGFPAAKVEVGSGDDGPSSEVKRPVPTNRRQTLVFSATLTSALEALTEIIVAKDPSRRPAVINLLPTLDDVKRELATNSNLIQNYVLCPEQVKVAYMIECLLDLSFKQCILFCGTRKEAKLIHRVLLALGMDGEDFKLHPVLLNSDLGQKARFAALEAFKSLKSRLLVTTDLANRGLDLPQVDLVINYNCPNSAVSYVHRVGRTCRRIDFKRESLLTNSTPSSETINPDSEQAHDADRPHGSDSKSVPAVKLQLTEKQKKEAENRIDQTGGKNGERTVVKNEYAGKAITIITQYDVKLLQSIEQFIGIKMTKEAELDEENVTAILRQVSIAIKDAEIRLEQEDLSDDAPNFVKARHRAKERRQRIRESKREARKREQLSNHADPEDGNQLSGSSDRKTFKRFKSKPET